MIIIRLLFVWIMLGFSPTGKAQSQSYEHICSKRYDYCFQLPSNVFMLVQNDVESTSVTYKTPDQRSSLDITNGNLPIGYSMHSLYEYMLGQWIEHQYKITLKKEFNGFFILSGQTPQGRGFYQKVIQIGNDYASAYLEYPRGAMRFSNITQLIYDTFVPTVLN